MECRVLIQKKLENDQLFAYMLLHHVTIPRIRSQGKIRKKSVNLNIYQEGKRSKYLLMMRLHVGSQFELISIPLSAP